MDSPEARRSLAGVETERRTDVVSKQLLVAGTVALGLALSGCTVSPGPGGEPTPVLPSDCGAEALQDRIGLPVTGTTAADVRIAGQPVLSRGTVRVIHPGQPVTEDYRPDRLNLEVNSAGNLVRAYCV